MALPPNNPYAPPPGGHYNQPGYGAPPPGYPPLPPNPYGFQVPYAEYSQQPASWGARAGAYLIDMLLLSIPACMFSVIMSGLALGIAASSSGGPSASAQTQLNAIVGLGFVLGVIMAPMLYFVIAWTRPAGQTLGQRIVSIRVIRIDGNRITFGTAFLRFLGFFLNTLPLYLGWLWPLWDPQQQGFHDKIAGTIVVQHFRYPKY